MKITKKQLRRIIKEEKAKLMEQPSEVNPAHELDDIVDELRSKGLEDLAVQLENWFEPMRFDWEPPDPYGTRHTRRNR